MHIDEYLRVALREVSTLWEEHWGVAMAVEHNILSVQVLCVLINSAFVDEPAEQLSALLAKPFRMPLHANHRFVLRALYGFYQSVVRPGNGAELIAWSVDRLMMKRIYHESVIRIYICKHGVWQNLHFVCLHVAFLVLRML